MLRLGVFAVLTMGLVGCGGDNGGGGGGGSSSGVDGSKQMSALTAQELTTYCEWQADELGGAGTETNCGQGQTYTVPTVDECAGSNYCTECDLSVSQIEACTRAMGNDVCAGGDQSCAAVLECAFACMGV